MKNKENDTNQIQDESHIQITASHTNLENSTSTNTEEENAKRVCSEIVVKVDESVHFNTRKDATKDFMVYECQRPNQKLPITWVFLQQQGGGTHFTPDNPLDYTPNRNKFIKMVFIILFIMLACTIAFNVLFMRIDVVQDIFEHRVFGMCLAVGAMVLMVSLSYAMSCVSCTRQPPCNYLCLVLAVIGMSILTGYIIVRIEPSIVLLAEAITAAIVLICVILACTSFDFTSWMLYVVVISAVLALIGLAGTLFMLISNTYWSLFFIIKLSLGTLVTSVMLVIELQMVLGGKAVELSEDDYALGAFLLYTSIVDLFIQLVQLLQLLSDE